MRVGNGGFRPNCIIRLCETTVLSRREEGYTRHIHLAFHNHDYGASVMDGFSLRLFMGSCRRCNRKLSVSEKWFLQTYYLSCNV